MVRSRAEYLIEKLISNTLSETELDELLEGLGKDEMLKQYSPILERYFNELIEQESHDFRPELTIDPDNHTNSAKTGAPPRPFQNFYAGYRTIVAFIVILFGIGTVYYFMSTHEPEDSKAVVQTSKTVPIQNSLTKEESVPQGKRKNLRLSDGSFVKLNSNTKIIFPEKFGQNGRAVSLKGEAYFDVEKDESRPFIISLGNVKVNVLGTSFNVKNYDNEKLVEIIVRSGRVGIHLSTDSSTSIILTKNQKFTFNKSTEQFSITDINASKGSRGSNNSLLFNNTPLIGVKKILEQWYDIDIIIENKSLYDASLTGRHHKENLISMLESISYAIDASYEINGRTIVIRN